MAFETGNPTIRLFKCDEEMAGTLVEAFREHIAPPISTLSTSPIEGWVGWRHLLDRDLDEENCLFVPWLYVSRMRAERKIPKALLRAYCKMAEAEELKARNLEFLPAEVKSEIRDKTIAELLPQMPPTLAGYGVVVDLATGTIYAETPSQKAAEAFADAFRATTGHNLAILSPEAVAVLRKGVNGNDLAAAVFTDDPDASAPSKCNLGHEFLTWLWFRWEKVGANFESTRGEAMEFSLDGPVAFFNEGKGAHNVVLRNGLPLQSREAGAALLCGKKVCKIRFSVSNGEQTWNTTIDSDFTFSCLKLPKDPGEPRQSFHERMALIETFVEAVFSLYDIFLDERADARAWKKTEAKAQAWVRERAEIADGDITAH